MQSIQDQLNSYREKGRRFKKWKKIVTALACVVVFCTVYALILPAITLEGDTYCNKEEHTHTDACYKEGEASIEKKFVCEKEEVEPHTHSDGCYEIRTIEVPVEETIEVPADEVESAVAAETAETGEGEIEPAAEPATVSETPATKTVTVTRMETKEEKVLVCEKKETEGHAHGDGCYEEIEIPGEKTLACEKEEHKHSKACYANPNADVETETDWEKTFEDVTFTHDWIEDTLAIAKSQLGYNESSDNYIILENGDTKGYTRYGDWYGNKYGDWCAMFVSFCLNYAEVEDIPLEAGCQNWILKIKDLEEASKDEEGVVQYNAWQEATDDYIPERGNIIFFNWDSAPDSDHVGIVVGATTDEKGNTTITTIEGNASNTVKYKEYALENTTIMGYGILPAQEFYCGMQGHAHDEECYDDAGKLICEIEEHIHTEECEAASELTEEEQAEVDAVIAAIAALPTADEFDAKLLEHEDAEDMEGYEAYWLEVQTACQEAYAMYEALSEELKAYVTNIDKLMELEWLWSVEAYVELPNKIDSDPVTVTESASTSEFVELNVFDYYGNRSNKPAGMVDINNRWQNVDEEYPGYQWNAGAYPYRYYSNGASSIDSTYGWIADRNLVDCIDFGNSLITDYEITDSLYEPDYSSWVSSYKYAGDVSSSKISVASASGANGAINAIDWGNGTGNTDRPVGYSSKFGASIGNKLGADGYPELKNSAAYGKSLKYLFYDDLANNYVYADKKNAVSVDGLFQQDPVSGEYYFDSRRNHAQYDDANDRFVLYDQTITPNFILYPFGNFLPFNDITNSNYATQVQAFDYQGGVKDYFQTMMDRLYTFQTAGTMSLSQRQLYRMLVSYKYNWMNWPDGEAGNGRKWDTITAADAINDYFNNSNEFSDEGWNFETDNRLQNIMTELYNIDYDVETNFFFGMEMKMNFMMPKDGMTGNDTNQDGKSDYPMKFIFEGDDDVWVYIDGILFLDLTGIHRHVGGEIDFVNGMVHYYQMESYVDGEVEDTPYYSMSFADILTKIGGVAQADLGKYLKYENGKYTTFKDYSSHDFNFYYMERGSGSSVCRINFNFPLLKKNSVSVTKELSPDADVTVMGNPDYYFNIVNPDNELFVGPNSKTGITSYTILDSGGNAIGTGETDEYGIFTLKAGQTAVFEGIEENEGEFFVQELIKEEDNGQYSKVYVNGGEARYAQLIDWSYRKYFSDSDSDNFTGPYGFKWYGHSGQDTDSSANRAFYFEADNGVKTSVLGKLSITKKVETYNGSGDSDKVYKMYVILDTKLIPVGTKYSVLHKDGTMTDETVKEQGCIEIKADETAMISNILSGTQFTVEEDSGSAKGYTVVYSAPGENQEEITSDGMGITGVIRTSATVEVFVTNTENGTTLNIPVRKVIDNPNDKEHTFKFQMQQVDENGKDLEPVGEIWESTENVIDKYEFVFALNYFEKDIDSLPVTYYYKLIEVTEETADVRYDQTEYLIEVKVSKDDDGLKAEIVDVKKDTTSLKEDGVLPEDLHLEFTNMLLEDLILEKQLKGATLDSEKTFKFAVTLKDKDQVPLNGTYKVIDANGTQEKALDDKGTFEVEVKAGSFITIQGIPLGTLWNITELETDGYLVTRTVTTESTEETSVESIESKEASGTVEEQTTVTFVNQTTYELPETGGIGTNPFIMGGLALMCCALFLLYNNKKRGKEETASS